MMTTSPSKKVDFTKPVVDGFGCKIRILCTDGPSKYYPVIGVSADGLIRSYTLEGYIVAHNIDRVENLKNTPTTVRVCFFKDKMGAIASRCCNGYSDIEAKRWGEEHICFRDVSLDE